jgi:hypothetical protein
VLFDFQRQGRTCHVAYPLPGALTRTSWAAPVDAPPGYLHLLEHLLIRTNLARLDALAREGSAYNAVTTPDEMALYLLSPAGAEIPTTGPWLGQTFSEADFDLERRTILHERALTPEGAPVVDRLLGTRQEIADFRLARLHEVRAAVGDAHVITYTASPPSAPARDCRPVTWTLFDQARTGDGEGPADWGRLLDFFVHMVDVAAPEPPDWASPDARAFVRTHKAELLFRYELAVTGLKGFDEEFSRYIRTVGLDIDVARSFEELPWEDFLPAA